MLFFFSQNSSGKGDVRAPVVHALLVFNGMMCCQAELAYTTSLRPHLVLYFLSFLNFQEVLIYPYVNCQATSAGSLICKWQNRMRLTALESSLRATLKQKLKVFQTMQRSQKKREPCNENRRCGSTFGRGFKPFNTNIFFVPYITWCRDFSKCAIGIYC